MKTGSRMLIIALALGTGHLAHSQLARAQVLPGSGGFECAPAPCVLPPTQASEDDSWDASIAADPLSPKVLLLGSHDINCQSDYSDVSFYLSTDGGSAWGRAECMPAFSKGTKEYAAVDEPSVGYDLKGNAYVSGLYSDGEGQAVVAVQKSSNGRNWGSPVVALREPGGYPVETHLAVDASAGSPRAGAVYVSGVMWTRYDQVLVSHSTDGGATWTPVPVDSLQKYPEEDDFTRTAVGRDGTVYVAWLNCRAKNNAGCPWAYIMLSKSSDGGSTWSSPQQIAKVRMAPDGLPHTYERVYDYPSIAADNSGGPYAGNLYVVMYTWTGSYLKVQVIRSTDGGNTWSQPVRLAPKSDTHDQFFPAISVSSTGRVGVSWLDRRNDPNDIDYQAFAAFSDDGGQHFGPNWQLTTAFSDPQTGNDNWMGDYTGNTWKDDSTFVAAWMDTSNGEYILDVVGGVRLK